MRCTYCGSSLHTIALCPKTWGGSVARNQLRCEYCGARDHDILACPKTVSGNAARAWDPESVADHFRRD
jgi:DNA-directed RNA polymerase subunit RPC12/RpoP